MEPEPSETPTTGPPRGRWEGGDPGKSSAALVLAGEVLCDAVDLRFGNRVLDVGTGTGNTALSAARRGARVTGIDVAPPVLSYARRRAQADGLKLRLLAGTAAALPIKSHSFDAVLSTFGVMFVDEPTAVAAELARVALPGGVIGVASWTPGGLLGRMYDLVDEGMENPLPWTSWGEEGNISKWFRPLSQEIKTARRKVTLRGPSVDSYIAYVSKTLGPFVLALEARDDAGKAELTGDLSQIAGEFNRAPDGTFLAPAEYLEAVVRLR